MTDFVRFLLLFQQENALSFYFEMSDAEHLGKENIVQAYELIH